MSTRECGARFVNGVAGDIAEIQTALPGIDATLAQLKAALEAERQAREADVAALTERLTREIAEQAAARGALERKQEEFEGKAKLWVGSLGKECRILKEQLAELPPSIDALAARMTSAEARLTELDAGLRLKFDIADADALSARVSELKREVDRDREEAAAAVSRCKTDCDHALSTETAAIRAEVERNRSTAAAATEACNHKLDHEINSLNGRLDFYVRQQAVDKEQLATDISGLAERLERAVKPLAKQADLEALDGRVTTEMQKVQEEMKEKATKAALNDVTERLTTLTMEVHANAAKAEAGDTKLAGELELQSRGLAKIGRQLDTEREHWSSCVLALERGLADRKVEVEALSTDITTVEAALKPLPSLIDTKASGKEVAEHRATIAALQEAVLKAAERSATAALELSLEEERNRREELQKEVTKKEVVASERATAIVRKSEDRFAKVEGLIEALKELVHTKADTNQVYYKDPVDRMLKDFYRKDEVNEQFSRVWWRISEGKSARVPGR